MRKTEYEFTKEALLDIIAAQNAMIEELLAKVDELERKQKKHTPAVVENGVLVQLERFAI